jgi:hypothetical protein
VDWQRRNFLVLAIFAPLLILTGIGGLTLPATASPMSNAVPYDVFHICFGALGLVLVLTKQAKPIAMFNLGFGAIDLWQAIAGVTGLPPNEVFALRPADHVAHVAIGAVLVAVGWFGLKALNARES